MVENKEDIEEEYINRSLPAPMGSLNQYMTEINKYLILSREEEYKLAMRYRKKET